MNDMYGSGAASDDVRHESAALASDLREAAVEAKRAATLAHGEYIPQDSREREIGMAFHAAARAATLIEGLAPRIAGLDGGDAGLLLARDALQSIQRARAAMREAQLLADEFQLTSASTMLGDAAECISGIADFATLAGTAEHDLFDAIVNAAPRADW